MSSQRLPVEPGLMERFRAAGAQIAWKEDLAGPPVSTGGKTKRGRAVRPTPAGVRIRTAHLNDEDARVEARKVDAATLIVVDSGPVGALVLLLELERRGPPTLLTTRDADPASSFPQGAIEARWDETSADCEFALPIGDLIQLARYALA